MQAVNAACLHSRDGRKICPCYFLYSLQVHMQREKRQSHFQPEWAQKRRYTFMAFFNSAVTVLQTLVVALGAGLGIWGAINLLEGYGNDNRETRS